MSTAEGNVVTLRPPDRQPPWAAEAEVSVLGGMLIDGDAVTRAIEVLDESISPVCIADVAHYVAAGSALDEEAYRRGTSVYFPDRALPMRPERLSNGVCSLNPHEDRLTKTVLIELNSRGQPIRSRFFDSVIRSHERMTYTDVRRILVDRDDQCISRYRPLVDQFKLMEELALLIYENRRARGNLDFDLPEAEIILDLQGAPENIVQAERNIAHRIIEEFMIAANEAVARYLTEQERPLLYRVHEGPDQEALEAIAPFCSSAINRHVIPITNTRRTKGKRPVKAFLAKGKLLHFILLMTKWL
jgi:VacB/RNase II family 3'-5' exoribonuclease